MWWGTPAVTLSDPVAPAHGLGILTARGPPPPWGRELLTGASGQERVLVSVAPHGLGPSGHLADSTVTQEPQVGVRDPAP